MNDYPANYPAYGICQCCARRDKFLHNTWLICKDCYRSCPSDGSSCQVHEEAKR